MMRRVHTLASTGMMLATAAFAQSGTATWEVSADGGVSWASNLFLVGPGNLFVRLRLGWTGIDNAIGFGDSQFDAVILGATDADFVTNINRPSPFDFAAQTLVATRNALGTKIDVSTDTALPGAGAGWVNPGQSSPDGSPPNPFNPVTVFTYRFFFDATGSRTFTHVFNPAAGRALTVYTGPAGAQTRLSANQVTINAATITIPAPATATLLALSCLGIRRRR